MVYNDAVTISSVASRNAYGEQVWGSGSSVKARVVEKSIETLDLRGERTMSDILVHLPLSEEDVSVGQKIEYDSVGYIVLKVSKPKNEVSHHRDVKLTCKKYGES